MPLLSTIRRDAVCRVAAAFVVFVLSGAPRVVAALLPEPEHRCECAAHGERHRCACPVCAAKARKARLDALEELPPCHRAAALQELAEEEGEAPDAPCVSPACGGQQLRAAVPALGDPFALPELPLIPGTGWLEILHSTSLASNRAPLRPGTPPPRA